MHSVVDCVSTFLTTQHKHLLTAPAACAWSVRCSSRQADPTDQSCVLLLMWDSAHSGQTILKTYHYETTSNPLQLSTVDHIAGNCRRWRGSAQRTMPVSTLKYIHHSHCAVTQQHNEWQHTAARSHSHNCQHSHSSTTKQHTEHTSSVPHHPASATYSTDHTVFCLHRL